jgi:hypothetical protein
MILLLASTISMTFLPLTTKSFEKSSFVKRRQMRTLKYFFHTFINLLKITQTVNTKSTVHNYHETFTLQKISTLAGVEPGSLVPEPGMMTTALSQQGMHM